MRDRSPAFLISLVVAMFIALAYLVVERDALRPMPRPTELQPLAEWLRDHPADWQAAAGITERALDTPSSERFELWRASWRLTQVLAPWRPQAATAFVKSGFFHWYELSPKDRQRVLSAAQQLLRDRDQFPLILAPVWELTQDMSFLRRANPGSVASLTALRELAATNGRFADYRELRDEVRQRRLEELSSEMLRLSPVEIIQRLPPDFDRRDEPLLKLVLGELGRRPLDTNPARATLERLIAYALRHDLPLQGVERAATEPGWISETLRMQLSARLRGLPEPATSSSSEWSGLCGRDVCGVASRDIQVEAPTTLKMPIEVVQTDETPPYVEVTVDDSPVAETAVEGRAVVDVPVVAAGSHRIEVRLINPLTRNLIRRRVRIL